MAGAAVMRGEQLADILRPAAEAEDFRVSVTDGLTEVRDAAVIMNKAAITEYGAAGVEQLVSGGKGCSSTSSTDRTGRRSSRSPTG
ncbi:hypothetical protein ACFQX4_18010 [Roseomonas sp. GCM10028921]